MASMPSIMGLFIVLAYWAGVLAVCAGILYGGCFLIAAVIEAGKWLDRVIDNA